MNKVNKVIYLRESKQIETAIKNGADVLPDVVDIKCSCDGNFFMITYENGIIVQIDRSNIVIIDND